MVLEDLFPVGPLDLLGGGFMPEVGETEDLVVVVLLPFLGVEGQDGIVLLLRADAEIVLGVFRALVLLGELVGLCLEVLVERRKVVGVVEGETEMVYVGLADGEEGAVARWMGRCSHDQPIALRL